MAIVRGLVPAVFTPLYEDGSVNYDVIPTYAKYMADAGVKGVLVGGTTGQSVCLSVAERNKIVDAWVEASRTTGLHIMVHVGGAPMKDVQELAKHCQLAGAHSLLTLPELYFKPTNVAELVDYVSLVAAAAPKLPIFYYHNPKRTMVQFDMAEFVKAATAKIPSFKGLKYSSNDLNEALQILRALNSDQEIYLGNETLLAPAYLMGIKSSTCTTFTLFPKLAQDILAAMENKNLETARQLQNKLSMAVEAITAEGDWVRSMKATMDLVGHVKVGPPALPQRALSSEALQKIAEKLKKLGLIH